MLDETYSVDVTRRDLELIEAALQTQEKILSVQSRAGTDEARGRLNDLKGLLRRLRRQVPEASVSSSASWGQTAKALFF